VLRQALRHDLGHDLALPPSLSRRISGDNAGDVVAAGDRQGQNPDRAVRTAIRQAETHPWFPRVPWCARYCAMNEDEIAWRMIC
jgi:hypothetical protein